MRSSAPVCPVPQEQQPINEYQGLKESWFFRWATLDIRGYIKPFIILCVLSGVLATPVAAASFSFAKDPAHFILSTAAGAMLMPLLALLRLYLGWMYVSDRLSQETVFYEESGWYDGQVWTKPEEVLQRDRLIVTYQIQSILKRLRLTFGMIALLFFAGAIVWNIF